MKQPGHSTKSSPKLSSTPRSVTTALHVAAEKGRVMFIDLFITGKYRTYIKTKNYSRLYEFTIPHKIEIMDLVDEISDLDRHIGSINTVISEEGKLMGLGTDGPGALKAIRDAGVDLEDKKVLMLGSGGAARAIAFTLAQNAGLSQLTLLDIDAAMLKQLASDLEAGTDAPIGSDMLTDTSLAQNMQEADLVIHCTPIGMHPNEDSSLVPSELFRPEQVIFDVVYTPLKTKLLKEAEARGLKTISGVEMFINQAVLQFERFTGVDAPEEVMHRVVMEHLES